MPCFPRKQGLSCCRQRDKRADLEKIAVKPVRTTAISDHGLFGFYNASQHLIVDDNWTPSSLTEQFANCIELLARRVIFKVHEAKTDRNQIKRKRNHLRLLCTNGRIKLRNISLGNNAHDVRNIFIKHRDMQRLYSRMPIHLIVDNVNQRTFTMRKERDRLDFHLERLQHDYKDLLLKRSEVENRIRYANEFIIQDEIQSRILKKKIENSNVRAKAIRTINTTYKKIIEILQQDEVFYEPILRSLQNDMEDQSSFINYILYLGRPAIVKFTELNIRYRKLQELSRKNLQSKIEMFNLYSPRTDEVAKPGRKTSKVRLPQSADPSHYERRTASMHTLKSFANCLEHRIKELKLAALCSQAKEIYPSVKKQMENNKILGRHVELETMTLDHIEKKHNSAVTLREVLINSLSSEEVKRLDRIEQLKIKLKAEETLEKKTIAFMQNRSKVFVTFRLCVWSLMAILENVDRRPISFRGDYPNSYLRLPLLKFEMLHMVAAPPYVFEENLDKLMVNLKRKVVKLCRAFRPRMLNSETRDQYHTQYLQHSNLYNTIDNTQQGVKSDVDDVATNKVINVLSSKQIKLQSARILENVKREAEN